MASKAKLTPGLAVILIGAGRMGQALAAGWLEGQLLRRLVVIEPNPSDALNMLLSKAGRAGCEAEALGALADLPPGPADALVLAVKPQIMDAVLPQCRSAAGEAGVILSVAAGLPLERYLATFGPDAPVVRAMPNTPAAIGKGVSALVAAAGAGLASRTVAERLMAAAGPALWLDREDQMDAVTALSGSGPAYVFHLIEAMARAGEALDLPADLAMALARQTVIGAAGLAEAAGDPASALREAVTSPGGTTEAALAVHMREPGLTDLMVRTMEAARDRSRALAT
ncbi:MAG: pyrroline-5-carboxylate reductase [Pseudomonadota bacterium]